MSYRGSIIWNHSMVFKANSTSQNGLHILLVPYCASTSVAFFELNRNDTPKISKLSIFFAAKQIVQFYVSAKVWLKLTLHRNGVTSENSCWLERRDGASGSVAQITQAWKLKWVYAFCKLECALKSFELGFHMVSTIFLQRLCEKQFLIVSAFIPDDQ